MIGLKRHTVQVVEHDPGWGTRFEAEARTVRKAIGDLVVDVQHVGSTAVAGWSAAARAVPRPVANSATAVAPSKTFSLICISGCLVVFRPV